MMTDQRAPDDDPAAGRSTLQRLGWMAAIWGISVAVIGVVAYAIRLAILG
jgi:hypothetical protein